MVREARLHGIEFCPGAKAQNGKMKKNTSALHDDNSYVIPEGGANANGIQGCVEIHEELPENITHILCPVGTGTTVAGLLTRLLPHQRVVAFSVFKNGDGIR